MSYPDITLINRAATAAGTAARQYAEVEDLFDADGSPIVAAQLLDSAHQHAVEARQLVAEELLAAAELVSGTPSTLFHEDYRDEAELRAAAAKLLNATDGTAGDTWRSHTERRAEAQRRSDSTRPHSGDRSGPASLAARLDSQVAAKYLQAVRMLDEAAAAAEMHIRAARLHDAAPAADLDGQLNARVLRNVTRLSPAARLLEAAVQLDGAAQQNPARRLLSAKWGATSARLDDSVQATQAEWMTASLAKRLFHEAERLLEESARLNGPATEFEVELRAAEQMLARELKADASVVKLFDENRAEFYDSVAGLLDEAAEAEAQLEAASQRHEESRTTAGELRVSANSAEALIKPFGRRRDQALHREGAERLRAEALRLQNETFRVCEEARDRLHAIAVRLLGAAGDVALAFNDHVAQLLGQAAESEADQFRAGKRTLELFTAAHRRRDAAGRLDAEWPRPRRKMREEAKRLAADANAKWRAATAKGGEATDAAKVLRRDASLLLAEAERLPAQRLAEAGSAEFMSRDTEAR